MITPFNCDSGFELKLKDVNVSVIVNQHTQDCQAGERSLPVEGEGSAGNRGALTRSMVTTVRDLLVVKRGQAQSACVIATGRVAT